MLCYLKSYTDLKIRLLGEAYHEFGAERLRNTRCLLTLGTGHSPHVQLSPLGHFDDVGSFTKSRNRVGELQALLKIAADCQKAHEKAKKSFAVDDVYWRFNYDIKTGEKVVSLDGWQGMELIQQQTDAFMTSPKQSSRVEKCASKLRSSV